LHLQLVSLLSKVKNVLPSKPKLCKLLLLLGQGQVKELRQFGLQLKLLLKQQLFVLIVVVSTSSDQVGQNGERELRIIHHIKLTDISTVFFTHLEDVLAGILMRHSVLDPLGNEFISFSRVGSLISKEDKPDINECIGFLLSLLNRGFQGSVQGVKEIIKSTLIILLVI
jgi:hypothetical protein